MFRWVGVGVCSEQETISMLWEAFKSLPSVGNWGTSEGTSITVVGYEGLVEEKSEIWGSGNEK